MKKIILLFALVSLCAAKSATATMPPPPPVQRVLGSVELLDVIKPDAEPLPHGVYKLSREWVGTLVPHEDKLAQTKLPPQQPEPLRLNCLRVDPDGSFRLLSVRVDDEGRLGGYSRFFRFMRELRSPDEILQTRELDTLKSWFGNQHGFTDGWGGPNGLHWSEQWMFFGPAQNETIICQNIFAHVFGKPSGAAQVDIMTFSDGIFRPANPNSQEERRMYPSENEKYAARLAKENARIDANPEPLRTLLKARHAPDDSELLAFRAAINRFRDKPDPLLIHQLVERLDEGTCEIQGLLETLMDESMGTSYLHLVSWKPENKKIAIEALIDALPEAPRYNADEVIGIILAETSLVTLKMDDYGINITVAPRTQNSGGYGYSTSGHLSIEDGLFRMTVLKRIAGELRRRWEASGFCVERYSAPAPEK